MAIGGLGGRQKLPLDVRKAISHRLRDHVQRYHRGNRAAFERAVGVSHSTAVGWFNPRSPAAPDTPQLMQIAEKANVNLNWLLLGHGPDLREDPQADDSVDGLLRARIVAVLKTVSGLDPKEVEESVPDGSLLIKWLLFRLEMDIYALADNPEYNEKFCKKALEDRRDDVAARWFTVDHYR